DADMSKVSWKYDENERLLLLDGEGEGKLDWDKEDDGTRSYRLPGAGFTPPDELRRPKEQDQAAPWMTEDYPIFSCWVTNVKLPPLQDKAWDYVSRGVNRQLGGVHYARIAGLERGVMHTVMSKQTLEPEITADEAKELNDALSGFDNKISFVYQIPKGQRLSNTIPDALASFLAALSDVDWTQPRNPCVMPLPPVRAAR
ncbi:MAG TPA: transglutaminase, partial [Caulobacteraceae bacterium]|nr:transglutaminase [Caulobacteraceae bacterium]